MIDMSRGAIFGILVALPVIVIISLFPGTSDIAAPSAIAIFTICTVIASIIIEEKNFKEKIKGIR